MSPEESVHHRISLFARWTRISVVLVLTLGLLGLGVAEAKKKKAKKPPPPADLPGHVSYLAWQLRGVPLDESEPLAGQIQKLVLDHLQDWLANRTATGVEVRRELESVFDKLRYPTFAKPACFDEPWKGSVLVGAGYTLGWNDYDRVNVLALFESREGKTRLAAVTNFVPRTDLQYEFLPARSSDAFWFFVYGTRLGKSQPRLSATLYAYDGQSLKPLWEARDVYDGKMDVEKDRVTIRYLKEEEYAREVIRGRKPPRYEAVYKFTPQGLELETEREIPFRSSKLETGKLKFETRNSKIGRSPTG